MEGGDENGTAADCRRIKNHISLFLQLMTDNHTY